MDGCIWWRWCVACLHSPGILKRARACPEAAAWLLLPGYLASGGKRLASAQACTQPLSPYHMAHLNSPDMSRTLCPPAWQHHG